MIEGMPTSFDAKSAKCKRCILGKQTSSSAPKTRREGGKATMKLEKVWVDLSGPHSVVSRSGNSYVIS